MVRGLDLFIDHFENFSGQYVLIGGVACDLALGEAGMDFRVTKDIDIVLCAEALNRPFVDAFWAFIRAGEYEIQEKATGEKQFYRFKKPRRAEFPFMLELFSRAPDVLKSVEGSQLTPIPVEEEIVSLSAILLDGGYYAWIQQGKKLLHGVPIVDPEHIIPLKARAWSDLKVRKAAGEDVNSKDIKKHKNDVFRLLAVIEPEPISDVPEAIKVDIRSFLVAMAEEEINFKELGLGKRDKEEVFSILRIKYGL